MKPRACSNKNQTRKRRVRRKSEEWTSATLSLELLVDAHLGVSTNLLDLGARKQIVAAAVDKNATALVEQSASTSLPPSG